MKRTPGSWDCGGTDSFQLWVTVERDGATREHHLLCASRRQAEEFSRSAATPEGRASVLARFNVTGTLAGVVGVYRVRSLMEKIDVRPEKVES
jgi:hypothetical protein